MRRARTQTTSRAERMHASYCEVLKTLEEDATDVDRTLQDGLDHLEAIERMSRETLMLARASYDQAVATRALHVYTVKVLKRRMKAAERKRWLLRRTGGKLVRIAQGRPAWAPAFGGAFAASAAIMMAVLVF